MTVHGEVPGAWVLPVALDFLSGLVIIVEADLAPLGLEVTAPTVRAPPLLVSSVGYDVTERAPGRDAVSVVSSPVMDSELVPTKGEEADIEELVFSLAILMRLTVAEASDLSEVQGPFGGMWVVRVVVAMSGSVGEALNVGSLPVICFDPGPEEAFPKDLPVCRSTVIAFLLKAVEGMTMVLAHAVVLSSDLSVTELVVTLGITKLAAEP